MDLIEKNPAAFINPHQPLMTSITGRFISAIFNTVLLPAADDQHHRQVHQRHLQYCFIASR
jgi:hypothetical protein